MKTEPFDHLLQAAAAVFDDYPILGRKPANAEHVLETVANVLSDGRISPFEILVLICNVVNLHSADFARVVVQLRQLGEAAVNEVREQVSESTVKSTAQTQAEDDISATRLS